MYRVPVHADYRITLTLVENGLAVGTIMNVDWKMDR